MAPYIDRARPRGFGKLLLWGPIATLAVIIVMATVLAAQGDLSTRLRGVLVILLIVVPGLAFHIHTAYHVEYRIYDGALALRVGLLYERHVWIETIRGAALCEFACALEGIFNTGLKARYLCWGRANVVIDTDDGKLWIGATDAHEFIRELRVRIDAERRLIDRPR